MTEFYTFAGEHPFLTFILACIAGSCFTYPFKIINRWIRHRNIVAQGWPPAHLDADGDLIEKEDK